MSGVSNKTMPTVIEKNAATVVNAGQSLSAEYAITIDSDRVVTISGVPDPTEGLVDIKLRPTTRRDRLAIQNLQNKPDSDERLISLLCIKWGDNQGISTETLNSAAMDIAGEIVLAALSQEEVRGALFRKPKFVVTCE